MASGKRQVRPTGRLAFGRIETIAILCSIGVLLGLATYFGRSDHGPEYRLNCLDNLGRIGTAIGAYLEDSDQRWPAVAKLRSMDVHDPAWPTLPVVLEPYVDDATVFRCPADSRTLGEEHPLFARFDRQTTYFATEGTSYEWQFGESYAGRRPGEDLMSRPGGFGLGRADQPLLRDFDVFHDGDGQGAFNTLFADLKARAARGDTPRRG